MLFEDLFYLRCVDVYNTAPRDLHSLKLDALQFRSTTQEEAQWAVQLIESLRNIARLVDALEKVYQPRLKSFFEPCRVVAVSIVRDVYIIVLSRTVRILYDTSGQPSLYSTEYDNSGDLSEPINSMLAYAINIASRGYTVCAACKRASS
jgi:hypothetical protein